MADEGDEGAMSPLMSEIAVPEKKKRILATEKLELFQKARPTLASSIRAE